MRGTRSISASIPARARPAAIVSSSSPDREQKNDDGRLLGCADQHRAERGDRHQRFDAERRAGDRPGIGASGERNDADEGRDGIGPLAPVRLDLCDGKRDAEHGAGEEDEPPFPALPPCFPDPSAPARPARPSVRPPTGVKPSARICSSIVRGDGPVFIERQRDAFLAVADIDVAHARQSLHRVFDLDRAGPAIHSFDAQFQGAQGRHGCHLDNSDMTP